MLTIASNIGSFYIYRNDLRRISVILNGYFVKGYNVKFISGDSLDLNVFGDGSKVLFGEHGKEHCVIIKNCIEELISSDKSMTLAELSDFLKERINQYHKYLKKGE